MNKVPPLRNLPPRKCARPLHREQGSQRAVLGIHGYTGYPGELAYPASRLVEAGFDVHIPRIPGHGTTSRDFLRTRGKDWIRRVRDEWLDLQSRYKEVFLLGHSMGGLLALYLAASSPAAGLALMAPAVGMRIKGMGLIPLISCFCSRVPATWESDPAYDFFDDRDPGDDAYMGKEYWSWTYFKQLADLLKIQRQVEKSLGNIKSPVLGIFGKNDTVIPLKAAQLLAKRLGGSFQELILSDSGHLIPYEYHPGEKEAAMDAVVDWFQKSSGL